MSHNEAQRTLDVIRKAAAQGVKSGAQIEYTYGQIAGLSDYYEASAYLNANFESASEGFRVPAGVHVGVGDYVMVAVDHGTGGKKIVEVLPNSLYAKISIDVNEGVMYLGDGASPSKKFSPRGWTYNAKDYGVKGDGVTDDTAAINDLIALVSAANYVKDPESDNDEWVSGGVIVFPAGLYSITTINMRDNVYIKGVGHTHGRAATTQGAYLTRFKQRDNTNGPAFFIGLDIVGIGFEQFSIEGNKANNTSGSHYGFILEDVVPAKWAGGTLNPTGVASTDLFTSVGHPLAVNDAVHFTGSKTGGAGLTYGRYWVISDGLTGDTFKLSATYGGPAVDFTTDLTASTLIHGHANSKFIPFRDLSLTGFRLNGIDIGAAHLACYLSDVFIGSCDQDGIRVGATDCVISNCNFGQNGRYNINVEQSGTVVVAAAWDAGEANIRIQDNSNGYGYPRGIMIGRGAIGPAPKYNVDIATGVKNVVIVGASINSASTSSSGTYSNVRVATADPTISIIGCTFYDPSPTTTKHDIEITGGGVVWVSGNNHSGEYTTALTNQPTLLRTRLGLDSYADQAAAYLRGVGGPLAYLGGYSNDVTAPQIHFRKSRNTTPGGQTAVAQNDLLGDLWFYGSDGTQFRAGALIRAAVTAAVSGGGAADMPTSLLFHTSADGSASPTEGLRLDHRQRLILGGGTGPQIINGAGGPESVISAPVGSIYFQTDGGSGTTLYVKESGTGNTGWVALGGGGGGAHSALSGLTTGDDHTQYRLESADHSHASSGLQGGQVAHSVLTGIAATDHHAAPAAGPDADVTIDAAGAAGTASTFARSGHGHKVVTTDAPSGANITIDAAATAAATGAVARAAHGHRLNTSSSAPAAIGTAAAGTSGHSPSRDDHVHPTGAGTPSTQAFGDAAATGTGPAAAMTDHKHAMMANPVTAHEAAGDPHTGYRLESADHSHASAGLQGGTVSHADLTGVTADQHHAQSHTHASHTGIGATDHHTNANDPTAGEKTWLTNGLAGQVAFPATQNASADANTLDDYEEGSWTPVLTAATPGNLSVVYTNQLGRYTKIGRLVTAHCYISTSTWTHTTASGLINVTGLPFTSANLFPYVGTGYLQGWTQANAIQLVPEVIHNTSTIRFVYSKSGGAASTFLVAGDMPSGTQQTVRITVQYIV